MGRPFNSSTPLGRVLLRSGWSVNDLTRITGINARHLSDYLANRRPIPNKHLILLAAALNVESEEIDNINAIDDSPPVRLDA